MLPFDTYSQNKISNGSFEIYDKLPNIINVSSCLPFCSEITRCLGHWDHYPWQYHWRLTPSGCDCQTPEQGCIDRPMEFAYNDGNGILSWYSPTWATADYFHNLTSSWRCAVPDNEFTQEGPGDPVEKQFPVGYVDLPLDYNTRAYVGLHFLRQFSNGVCLPNNAGRKNEYIQKKLDTPLESGKTYKVSFSASRAFNYGTGHFFTKKSLKAYFTQEPLLKDECQQDITPFDIEDSDLLNTNLMSVSNENEELSKGGGPNGNIWKRIEGYITVRGNENLYYMTLGNFKNNWIVNEDVFSDGGNFNGLVDIYYFIDDVKIEEITIDCLLCSEIPGIQQPGYHVTFEEQLRQNENDECCVNLKILPGSHALTCDADQIVIYKTEWNGSAWIKKYPAEITKYQNSQNPPGDNFKLGEEIEVGQLCYNKSLKGSVLIIIEYWKDGVKQSECLKAFDLQCRCECPQTANDLLIELENITEPEDENCCWDLKVLNNADCDIALDVINVEVDKSKVVALDYAEELLFDLDQTEPGRYVWNLTGNKLFPTQTPLSIGKICLQRGVSGVTCSVNSVIEGSLELCTQFNTVLNCNCCDSYNVQLNSQQLPPELQDPTRCCWIVSLAQITNEACIPDRIKIRDNSIPNIIFYNGDYFYPFNIPPICINGSNPATQRTIFFEFYDSEDNVLCNSINIPVSCFYDPGQPGQGMAYKNDESRAREKIIENNLINQEISISNVTLIPNPAGEKFNVEFDIYTDASVNFELFNIFGIKVFSENTFLAKKGRNSIKFNTENISSGLYFIKLEFASTYLTKSLIINK